MLLVDDDSNMLALLEAILTTGAFDLVGLASNGADAVKVATTIAPDLAIVDYMMPGMNGFETATAIKKVRPACCILIFSALDLHEEAERHPDVDYFLGKRDITRLEKLLNRISVEQGLTGPS